MRRIVSVMAAAGAAMSAHAQIVVGPDEGGPPVVRVYDPLNPMPPLAQLYPAAPNFLGGIRVAVGDVNGDGVQDTITGLGPGGPPEARVFSGNGNLQIAQFVAYGPSFTGGVFVGSGDINGDGRDDVITGAGPGAGPHVKVFSGANGAQLASFFAFSPSFTGGVTVAAGDVDGNGGDDILVGGSTSFSHVKVFSGATGAEIRSFLAFPGFTGGVFVAGGDVNGDGFDDIIVGAGAGAPGGHVKVFDGSNGALLASFLAYETGFQGGVRVGAVDRDGDGRAEIITGSGAGATPHVKIFSASGAPIGSFVAGDPGFTGGIFVAGFDGGCYADCTGDNVLTVADFGCFQTKFVGGSPYADCNGDGARTVADFGCFQTKFVQGCP